MARVHDGRLIVEFETVKEALVEKVMCAHVLMIVGNCL
jgi:hypothetical protein